ncbi:MAG: GntR family transcriptional regulator [Paracoccaceae bacterium]
MQDIAQHDPFTTPTGVAGVTEKQPAHEHAYRQLRDMVLFGDLAPGQPVTIQGLTSTLRAGMTPVREAIRRLTSEGALIFQGNRRVSVPILTQQDIEDLIFLRKTVEPELARRAALVAQVDQVTALRRIDKALDQAIAAGDIRGYLRGNYRFHATLYQMANAPVLTETTDRMWLRFGPSLRVVCGRLGTQNLPDFHKVILDALDQKDADAAAAATARDLEQGMSLMVAALSPTQASGDSIDTK